MRYINKFFIQGRSNPQFIRRNYDQQALKYFIIAIIVLVTAIKLDLIGAGFLAFPDEVRYCESGRALQNIAELKIDAAIKDIYLTQGRPADAIVNIIPNALQYLTARIFNLSLYEPENTYPLFLFNFVIYCLILIIFYKIANLLLKDNILALISVLLYSTLTNSYVYLRHALPYDLSLLIFYFIIYKIVIHTNENNLSFLNSLIIGFCSFLGFLVYPGYFPLFIVAVIILFFNNLSKIYIYKKLYYSGSYILGSIVCLVIFDKIGRIAGRSYIYDAIDLSKTITQGSFKESFSFILKYLFGVEGITGIFLLVGLSTFFLIMLYRIKNKTFKQYSLINLLAIALLVNYLAYASAGYFFHKVVFYGRLLHQYLPFICILSIYSINKILNKLTRKSKLVLSLISIMFIVNFGVNFINYKSCSYPRDILWNLIKTNNPNNVKNIFAYDDHWPVMPIGSESIYTNVNEKFINSYYNIILIGGNFSSTLYLVNPLNKDHIFNPDSNYHLLESKSSFMNFKAYQFDSGASMIDRHNMDKRHLKIKIFSANRYAN
jgi:hypothetical protein